MVDSARPLPVVPHHSPEPVSLACAATACTYNEEEHCEADEVSVQVTEQGPVCGTFESRDGDGRMLA
jgi:hypothetical protein